MYIFPHILHNQKSGTLNVCAPWKQCFCGMTQHICWDCFTLLIKPLMDVAWDWHNVSACLLSYYQYLC